MTESKRTPQTKPGSRKERLIALCVFGLLALNYPLLALFDNKATWFDIPILFLYLLAVWGSIIVTTAWVLESRSKKSSHRKKGLQK